MGELSVCVSCGHRLAAEHRFCASCGAPAGERAHLPEAAEQTVERTPSAPPPSGPPPSMPPPRVPPPSAPPPPPPAAPPPPRYPLFADEVTDDVVAPQRVAQPDLLGDGPEPVAPVTPPSSRRARNWLPWLVGALALLLVASFGALLMLGGSDDDQASEASSDSSLDIGSPEASAPFSEPAATEAPDTTQPKPGKPAELARSATVSVPAVAPPNQDVDGNRVEYDGENMLDGDPTTAWRMPDSAAGESVVLRLSEPARLTEVGLINGYAKSSGALDWYEGNRRIRKVVWIFDGGEEITQELDDDRDLQVLRLKPVVTSSVTMRITRVSTPGKGRAARDYTAVSEVSLVGSPAA